MTVYCDWLTLMECDGFRPAAAAEYAEGSPSAAAAGPAQQSQQGEVHHTAARETDQGESFTGR